MRNRILGAIGVLWGGGLLLSFLLGSGSIEGTGSYATGQVTALIFGGVLFAVGLYYLLKGSNQ